MLDLKQIRENPEEVQKRLDSRGGSYDIAPILQLNQQQKALELERSSLQARGNEIGKLVGQKVKSGSDVNSPEILAMKTEGNEIKSKLAQLEPQEKEIKAAIDQKILDLPNLPSETTPIGKDERENVEVRRWGEEYKPTNPNILPHWEIGEKLGILDFERAVKIAQSRFVNLIALGAALERALINFDHPRAIDFELLVNHLKELKEGKTIEQPVYSFITHNRTDDTIVTHPRKVMIVEGILILANAELRDLFDVKVFVHADSDERLIRRLKRDIAERGRDMEEVLNRYQTTLKPMHQQFIEPTKAFADIIIPNDKYNTVAIDVVRAVINQRIT